MWTLKKDDDGNPVLKDGVPVYVDTDSEENQEMTFDPNRLASQVKQLRAENKKRRETNEKLEERLAAVEDIEDLEEFKQKADEAFDTVANLKDKDMKVAERAEKLKTEMKATFEGQVQKLRDEFGKKEQEFQTELEKRDNQVRNLTVSNRFASSPYFSGEDPLTVLTPDIGEAYFGKHFKVVSENGDRPTIQAVDSNGEVIMSKEKYSEPADFDEALGLILESYPNRDRIMASTKGGAGSKGGTGVPPKSPVEKLKAQYKEAQEAGDVTRMTSLKNRIYEAQAEQQ